MASGVSDRVDYTSDYRAPRFGSCSLVNQAGPDLEGVLVN